MIKINLLKPKFSISMRLLNLALNEWHCRRYKHPSNAGLKITNDLILFIGDSLSRTLTPIHYKSNGDIDFFWKPRHRRISEKINVLYALYDKGDITKEQLDEVSKNIIQDEPND